MSTGTTLDIRSEEHAAFTGKNIEKEILISAAKIMKCGILQVWVFSLLNPSFNSPHTPFTMPSGSGQQLL